MHISQVSCTNHHNRSYHVSPAMDYHTSFSTHFPDKKAKVEKAVDTMKEKKKKEPSDTPSKVSHTSTIIGSSKINSAPGSTHHSQLISGSTLVW